MQMSDFPLFVFVEGRDSDPYFYDRLCHSVCAPRRIKYQVVRANRLRAGGKQALIAFHAYLQTVSSLIDGFKGKRTTSIFFLDKDLDDLMHRKLMSDHVVYTKFYDVENYLFVYGDLLGASCAASSQSHETLERVIGKPAEWRRDSALLWREWVVLCIFARKHDVRNCPNYKMGTSPINVPSDEPAREELLDARIAELRRALGWKDERFDRALKSVERLVGRLYGSNQYGLCSRICG